MAYRNKDGFGYGTAGGPSVPFEQTAKTPGGLPRPAMYPKWYDQDKQFIGLNETPSGGTGLEKNIMGMPEAWQHSPTGNVLDTENIDFENIDQVKAIQSAIGATADGRWGPETQRLYREAISQRRDKLGLDQYSYGNEQIDQKSDISNDLRIITDPDEVDPRFNQGFQNNLYQQQGYGKNNLFGLGTY